VSARDTRTGGVLEAMVLRALREGGYDFQQQVRIGSRPGGGRHVVDAVVETEAGSVLVSLKWQQVRGTAEQKVPFEVICLAQAVASGSYRRAYLVLGGEGWTLREFFTDGGLVPWMPTTQEVEVLSLEGFVARANRRKL
jgi:hypothetical protein